MKKKLTTRLLTVVLALAMVFGMSITTFAAPEDVASVNDEIVCNEGAYNVTVFGKAISVATANTTTIIPNNVSTKIDVMVNGKLFKGMKRVIVNKDEQRDRIVLEKGSYILDAATFTQKQIDKAVKSLLGTEAIPEMDAKSQVYVIGEKGKVLDATGAEQSTMLRTEGNYISLEQAYTTFAEEMASAAKVEVVQNLSSGCSSSLSSDNQDSASGPELIVGVHPAFPADNKDECTASLSSDKTTLNIAIPIGGFGAIVLKSKVAIHTIDELMDAMGSEDAVMLDILENKDISSDGYTLPEISEDYKYIVVYFLSPE